MHEFINTNFGGKLLILDSKESTDRTTGNCTSNSENSENSQHVNSNGGDLLSLLFSEKFDLSNILLGAVLTLGIF